VINDFLRRQDGVITREQAQQAGLSQDAINRRLRSGAWRRCAPGVYFAEDHRLNDRVRLRVAVWSYGPAAVASGTAAAWWHGILKVAPHTIEVTVPRDCRRRRREGVRVRRRDLKPADIVELHDIRVTSLALTTVEAAVRPGGGAAIVDTALQRHTELPPLWQAHLRNKGRHGSPRARRLLQAAGDGGRSAAERLFIQLLKNAGITGWVANHPVGGYLIDFAFPATKVAIEIDGFAFHHDVTTFNGDRVRQNKLALLGWQVLRFTWRDLIEQPARVIAEVRRATCGV
jgi:very-short-patch-repair endonuclease